MNERISAIIFNCREALVKLEELRDKIKETEIKRQEFDVKIQDVGIKSQETVFKRQESGNNIEETIVKKQESRDKIQKVDIKRQEIGAKKEEDDEFKELEQQSITIAERYIIFHDAIVKLEGMVKEVNSNQSSLSSNQ